MSTETATPEKLGRVHVILPAFNEEESLPNLLLRFEELNERRPDLGIKMIGRDRSQVDPPDLDPEVVVKRSCLHDIPPLCPMVAAISQPISPLQRAMRIRPWMANRANSMRGPLSDSCGNNRGP